MSWGALLGSLPEAEWLLADRGYEADWIREALRIKGIKPLLPEPKISCQAPQTRQTSLQATQ